jgi:uncharacterized protein (DUF4415 family)
MAERPVIFDDDNPEWSEEDFARARPITDFPQLMAAFPKVLRTEKKEVVALAIDNEVLTRFRAAGPNWRRDMNDALRKAVGL